MCQNIYVSVIYVYRNDDVSYDLAYSEVVRVVTDIFMLHKTENANMPISYAEIIIKFVANDCKGNKRIKLGYLVQTKDSMHRRDDRKIYKLRN